MTTKITIDPITRIEGHLRIDADVDQGKVSSAWASCTMWRGIETILLGRDPREAWVFAQRFCGVCTTVHAMASVRAVENALQLEVPLNAQYIRNVILLNHALHDHIVHWYHLSALDFVDILKVLDADPAKASALGESLSPWPNNSKRQMESVKAKIGAFAGSGQLGIFANGYWGHPQMRLEPEVNLLLVSHYLQALEFQRKANQVVAILGGKTPHIQNLAVGGVMNAINLDSLATMNMDRLYNMKVLIEEVIAFVHQVYFIDACAAAALYTDWFDHGKGVTDYLAVPDLPLDTRSTKFDLPGGTITNGDLSTYQPLSGANDERFRRNVIEDSTRAWYRDDGPFPPWQGQTVPLYTDHRPEGKYSFVKAPRFENKPMQVGPLASVLVAYAAGHQLTRKWTDHALRQVSAISGKTITIDHLHSTMGRYLARAIRAAVFADLELRHWELLTNNILSRDVATYNPPTFPAGEIAGVGVHEAPRGTLSHWVVLENGIIKNYQAVVPTTWNASPRDKAGNPGPYEASLLGTPVADPEQPLEVLRTVHSFDPCMACACHVHDPLGRERAKVRVL